MEQTIKYRLPVRIQRHLCPEGQQLYQCWEDALRQHAPVWIYAAMLRYFHHRNGVRNIQGKIIQTGCRICCITFERIDTEHQKQ